MKYLLIVFCFLFFTLPVLSQNQKEFEEKDCIKISDKKTVCAEIKINYPEILLHTKNKKILKYFLQQFNSEHRYKSYNIDSFKHSFFQDFHTTYKEDKHHLRDWTLEINIEQVYSSTFLKTFSMGQYSYTGGAHPNTYVTFCNFDLVKNRVLKYGDIFQNMSNKEFLALIERTFRKQNNIPKNDSLSKHGYWFDEQPFSLSEQFGFNQKGLIVFYNPYEIAPYVMGSTDFEIPWTELTPFLKSSFKY